MKPSERTKEISGQRSMPVLLTINNETCGKNPQYTWENPENIIFPNIFCMLFCGKKKHLFSRNPFSWFSTVKLSKSYASLHYQFCVLPSTGGRQCHPRWQKSHRQEMGNTGKIKRIQCYHTVRKILWLLISLRLRTDEMSDKLTYKHTVKKLTWKLGAQGEPNETLSDGCQELSCICHVTGMISIAFIICTLNCQAPVSLARVFIFIVKWTSGNIWPITQCKPRVSLLKKARRQEPDKFWSLLAAMPVYSVTALLQNLKILKPNKAKQSEFYSTHFSGKLMMYTPNGLCVVVYSFRHRVVTCKRTWKGYYAKNSAYPS